MRSRTVGGLLALALLSTGCEGFLTSFAAGSTIRVVSRGSVGIQRFADPELAESAIPGSLSTLEALLVIKGDSDALHLTLARSYASYGFGFMEDHMEAAMANDDESRAEHFRARATAAFLRARQLSFEMMSIWEPDDGGVEGHVRRGPEAFRAYLNQFDDQEQGGILFWGAYSWARYIGLHRDDPNALADLPFVGFAPPTPTLFPFVEGPARLAAAHLAGAYALPGITEMERVIVEDEQKYIGHVLKTPRHTQQVDYFIYEHDIRARELPRGRARAAAGAR